MAANPPEITAAFDAKVREWSKLIDSEENLIGYMPTADQVRELRALVRVYITSYMQLDRDF